MPESNLSVLEKLILMLFLTIGSISINNNSNLLFAASSEQFVLADYNCPLVNPAYKGLKSSITELLNNVKGTDECKDNEQLKKVTEQLSDIVKGIDENKDKFKEETDLDKLTEEEKKERDEFYKELITKREKITTVFDGLKSINSFMTTGCGKESLKLTDYVSSFLSTLVGLTPLAILYGGDTSASYLFGSAIAGSTINAWIALYSSGIINMEDGAVEDAFLKNVCTYKRINDNVEALMYVLELREDDQNSRNFQNEIATLKANIAKLTAVLPKPQANSYIAHREKYFNNKKLLKKLNEDLKNYSGAPMLKCNIMRSNIGTLGASIVNEIRAYAKGYDFDYVNEKSAINDIAKFDNTSLSDCADSTDEWLQVMQELLDRTRGILNDVIEGDSIDNFTQDYLAKEAAIKKLQKKIDIIQDIQKKIEPLKLNSNVASANYYDEINKVRDFIFDNNSFISDSPAYTWLKSKEKRIDKSKKSFENGFEKIQNSLKKGVYSKGLSGQKKDHMCNQIKTTWKSFISIKSNIRSMLTFCSTVANSLDSSIHEDVYNYCFNDMSSESSIFDGMFSLENLDGSASVASISPDIQIPLSPEKKMTSRNLIERHIADFGSSKFAEIAQEYLDMTKDGEGLYKTYTGLGCQLPSNFSLSKAGSTSSED